MIAWTLIAIAIVFLVFLLALLIWSYQMSRPVLLEQYQNQQTAASIDPQVWTYAQHNAQFALWFARVQTICPTDRPFNDAELVEISRLYAEIFLDTPPS